MADRSRIWIHMIVRRFPHPVSVITWGAVATAGAVDLATALLRWPWTLFVGDLTGTAVIGLAVLWKWPKGPFSDAMRYDARQMMYGLAETVIWTLGYAVCFALLVAFGLDASLPGSPILCPFCRHGGPPPWVQSAPASVGDWLTLALIGAFFPFAQGILLLVVALGWARIAHLTSSPDARRNRDAG